MSTGPILHADADAFFASVAMRSRPELRDVPFAVGIHLIIASANYAARARGIRGGMFTGEALNLCPELIVLDVPRAEVEEVGDALFDLFHEIAGAVEPGSIEEAFLDVGARDWAHAESAARELRHRAITELGIPVSVGIGRTKLMAKLASKLAKPDGIHIIDSETESDLRSSLTIDRVWGVGELTRERLESLGVHRLADLDGVDRDTLARVCGTGMSRKLVRMRNGTDDADVKSVRHRTSLSSEGSIAGYDRPDWSLAQLVSSCVRRVCHRAGRANLAASTLTLTLQSDPGAAPVILKRALEVPTANEAPCLLAAKALVESSPHVPVTSARVTLSGLIDVGNVPQTLF